jgi:hypothetical protein
MQYVGFGLLGLTVIGLALAIWQKLRMSSILAAPFRQTGLIPGNAGAADAKGRVSCEGAIGVIQPLMAPCSQQPCVYYKIELTRHWEEQVQTENGLKTRTGSDNLGSEWGSQRFLLDDGSGAVAVEADEDIAGDLERSFKQRQSASFGTVTFGGYQVNLPVTHGPRRTTGVKVVEKIIPAQGNLFVLGQLAGDVIRKKDGMLGKLLLSTKGRDKLIGATKRNMTIAFIVAALALGPGVYFSIFGQPPVSSCDSMTDSLTEVCTGRINTQAGATHTWTVNYPGQYTFTVAGTGTSATNRLWPKVTVTDAMRNPVLVAQDANGQPVNASATFAAGVHTIHITDAAVANWAERMHGGLGYSLNITGAAGALPAQPGALPAQPVPVPQPGALPAQPGAVPPQPAPVPQPGAVPQQ